MNNTIDMPTGTLRENLSAVFERVKLDPFFLVSVTRHNNVQGCVVSAQRANLTKGLDRDQLRAIRDAIDLVLEKPGKVKKGEKFDLLQLVTDYDPDVIKGAISAFFGMRGKRKGLRAR